MPQCPPDRHHQPTRRSNGVVRRRSAAGQLFAQVFVPNQHPFDVSAQLIAFNGKTKAGRPAVLVHAYSERPPVSFVIPFSVHHKPGTFRTVLVALIRRSAGPWPHVANFQVSVSRSFHHDGRETQLPESVLPGAPAVHGRLPLLRPGHLHLRGRKTDLHRIRPLLPRAIKPDSPLAPLTPSWRRPGHRPRSVASAMSHPCPSLLRPLGGGPRQNYSTAFLSSAPALNFGTVFAAICIVAPVWGLRP